MDTETIIERHTVPSDIEKKRLSDYLVGIFSHLPSRKSVKKAIDNNQVLVNGNRASTGLWVQPGMQIELLPKTKKPVYELNVPVVYEDEHLAIVNKPAGLATSGNDFKTLENTLSFNLKVVNGFQPQPVHRLDRATSGLLIVAKSAKSRILLGEMLADRKVNKSYHAIVHGNIEIPHTIDTPIDGKPATTVILEVMPTSKQQFKLLKLSPHTGRTHQLRIHCAQSGFSIVGDTMYGDHSIGKGLLLCATQLSFIHPINDTTIDVSIPLPRKFQKLLT